MKKMKTSMKVCLLVLCAMMLVVSSVLGTLAYLTSTDEVINTFTVGKVEISLDETDVDLYGVKDGEARVQANTYKLMPGHSYTKDPTVHVAEDSEPCYLYVWVKNDISAIEDGTTVAAQLIANGWTLVTGYKDLYYQVHTVEGEKDYPLFSEIKIKTDVDYETLMAYDGRFIDVKAYAVQKDGFDTALAAWNATFVEEYQEDETQIQINGAPEGVKITAVMQEGTNYIDPDKTIIEVSNAAALQWVASADSLSALEEALAQFYGYNPGTLYTFNWTVKLMDNIDFDGAEIEPMEYWWKTLDGNGKTISNAKVMTASPRAGLFDDSTSSNVTGIAVSNLTLSGITVTTTSREANTYAGVFAGNVADANISNVTVTDCTVNHAKYAGGLMGQLGPTSTVSNCAVNNTTVTGIRAGGIAGDAYTENGSCTIDACTVDGITVTATDDGSAGYILGRKRDSTVVQFCTAENVPESLSDIGLIA